MAFGILGERFSGILRAFRADFETDGRDGNAEARGTDKVPGTGLLSDQGVVHGHKFTIDEAKGLKRGTGKNAHVVLIPQPSDDPRDPCVVNFSNVLRLTVTRLNWPKWKKDACFWTL